MKTINLSLFTLTTVLYSKVSETQGVFESSNCLEMDDEQYFEYYACGVEITEIMRFSESNNYEVCGVAVGKLIEVSELNEPIRIEAEGKGVIWQK
ncbi:MAG: hypothetical protein ACOX8S_12255 [Christensenellales bacterium]|jgi:hypothetical protein